MQVAGYNFSEKYRAGGDWGPGQRPGAAGRSHCAPRQPGPGDTGLCEPLGRLLCRRAGEEQDMPMELHLQCGALIDERVS